jgi:phosphoenolpyruvate phosphomutase
MRIYLDLTDEQSKFLQDHLDFNLQDWFNRILNDKINETEVRSENVSAVIAAAGHHSRIPTVNSETPISMLQIKGKTLLERQIEVLKKFAITDITVVRGYKKELFTVSGVIYVDNVDYDSTGILHSFFLASERIVGKTLLLYGDILFESDIVRRLIYEPSDFAVVVDRSWRDHYHDRVQHTISEAELVEVRGTTISRMGRGIAYDSAYGEFIGLSSLSTKGAEKAKNLYEELKHAPGKAVLETEDLSKASLASFFNALIAKGEKVVPVDVLGGWFEIDTFEDYRKSWTVVK